MGTKEITSFVPVDPTFPLPHIKQAVEGKLHPDFLQNCTALTAIPSGVVVGEKISFSLHVESVGSFSHTKRTITQELLDIGEVVWQLSPYYKMARPGAIVLLNYTIYRGDDRMVSLNQQYTVANLTQ